MTNIPKTIETDSVSGGYEESHLYSINKNLYIHAHKYLTVKQVNSIFDTGTNAYHNDTPLNRFFTIHYDAYADKKRYQKFMVDLLERTRKWLKYRNIPVAYVYVIENAKIKGIHVHLFIHIPAHYQKDYKKAMRRWLPFEWTTRSVNVKTIQYPTYGDLSPLHGMYGILRYMCKALDPKTPAHAIKPSYQGKIFGKRWGISRGGYSKVKER